MNMLVLVVLSLGISVLKLVVLLLSDLCSVIGLLVFMIFVVVRLARFLL